MNKAVLPSEVFIVEEGRLVKWHRLGECKACGRCCCKHVINYRMETVLVKPASEAEEQEAIDWSDYEGWAILFAQGMWWYFKITSIEDDQEHRCEQLSDGGKCSVWLDPEHFRPICRYWPFHPDATFPGCGFSFKRKEEEQ